MADEAKEVQAGKRITSFNVADATTILIGSLMQLGDNRTCALSAGANPFAGVAVEEKDTGDGVTQISLSPKGSGAIYKMTASAAITSGARVALSAVANKVMTADADALAKGEDIGQAYESATGADDTFEVCLC